MYEARFQTYAQLSQAALTRGVIDPRNTSPNAEREVVSGDDVSNLGNGSYRPRRLRRGSYRRSKLVIAVGEEIERAEPDLYRLRDIQR